MGKIRIWGAVAIVAVVAVFAAGWFVLLSPQKSKVAHLHDQASAQLGANKALQSQIALLKKQQAQIPAEQARIAAIKSRLPDNPALAAYIRSLTAAAAATNVELLSIAPGAPTAVHLTAAAQLPTPASTSSPAAKPTGSAAASAPGAAPAPAAPATLSAIALSISVNGDYYAIQQFLSKLQGMQRATVVSSVTIHPGQVLQPQSVGVAATPPDPNSEWKTLGAEISASIFVSSAPASVPAAAGGAAATGPTASASPSTTVNN